MDHSTNQSPGTLPTSLGEARSRKRPRSDSSGSLPADDDTKYRIYKGDIKLVRGRDSKAARSVQFQGVSHYSNIWSMLEGLMNTVVSDERLPVDEPMSANLEMLHEVDTVQASGWENYNTISELRDALGRTLQDLKTKTVLSDSDTIFVVVEVVLGKDKALREQRLEEEKKNLEEQKRNLEKELQGKDHKMARLREDMIKMAEERQSVEVLAAQLKIDAVRAKLDSM